MSQIPPPPPGQPAPMGAAPGGSASNKNLYTILAWGLFPPIGSLIFLFAGKDDPDVKYNAAQAVVIHGAALAVYIILWVLTIIVVFFGILLFIWGLVCSCSGSWASSSRSRQAAGASTSRCLDRWRLRT